MTGTLTCSLVASLPCTREGPPATANPPFGRGVVTRGGGDGRGWKQEKNAPVVVAHGEGTTDGRWSTWILQHPRAEGGER